MVQTKEPGRVPMDSYSFCGHTFSSCCFGVAAVLLAGTICQATMRRAWQVLAALLAAGLATVYADARHDALDPTKHPPEHFYVNGKR